MRLVGTLEASAIGFVSSHKYGRMGLCSYANHSGHSGSPFSQLKSRAAKDGRSVHELIPQSVEADLELRHKRFSRRISLPLIRSKRPGALRLDNAKIFTAIPFP